MRENKIIHYLLLIIVIMSSCNKMNPKDYIKFIEQNNAITKTKIIGNWKYTLKYLPNEYQILKAGINYNSKDYKLRIDQSKGTQYYLLIISSVDSTKNALEQEINSKEEYNKRLYYLEYKTMNDLKIKKNDIEYPVSISHFERSFNMNKKINISFLINSDNNNEERIITYDAHMFQSGIIKFYFNEKDFTSIPKLN